MALQQTPEQEVLDGGVDTPITAAAGQYGYYFDVNDSGWKVIDDAGVIHTFGSGSNLESIVSDPLPLVSGTVVVTHAAMKDPRTVQVYADVPDVSTNLAAGATPWEPLAQSTLDANINNANLTDLCYNNSTPGTAAGWHVGVDLGAPTQVNSIILYDWSVSWYATAWDVVNSTDGSTLNVVQSITGHSVSLAPDGFVVSFPAQTVRWWGVRCVTPINATYWVVSELELFDAPLVRKALTIGVDYDAEFINATQTRITVQGTPVNPSSIIIGEKP